VREQEMNNVESAKSLAGWTELSLKLTLIACSTLCVLVCSGAGFASDKGDHENYALAIQYCRSIPGQKFFNEELNVFCFDGEIIRDQDVERVQRAKGVKIFVVRSHGGDLATASKIAELLNKMHVGVVIYDYCLSACALFFLPASDGTYVAKDSLVAWHLWHAGAEICGEVIRNSNATKRLRRKLCSNDQPLFAGGDDETVADNFLATRVIPPTKFTLDHPPQSDYVANRLVLMFEQSGVFPDVLWTWNPRYSKNTLKTQVEYEAYPESQDQVDDLAKRLLGYRANRVIYDP
jgi:hypothetical protein